MERLFGRNQCNEVSSIVATRNRHAPASRFRLTRASHPCAHGGAVCSRAFCPFTWSARPTASHYSHDSWGLRSRAPAHSLRSLIHCQSTLWQAAEISETFASRDGFAVSNDFARNTRDDLAHYRQLSLLLFGQWTARATACGLRRPSGTAIPSTKQLQDW